MSPPKIYTWGEWRFEPHESRLMHAGERIALPVKTLDVLTLLLSRKSRLVTKADILSTVWPDAAVEEGNIAFHVAALRKVLDVEGEPTCIETVRGRGYRFVAPVVSTPFVPPPSTHNLDLPPSITAIEAAPRRSWLWRAALWAAVMVVLGGLGLMAFELRTPAPVLVAPFEIDDVTLGADPGDTLTRDVVAALSESGVAAITRQRESEGATPRAAAARVGARVMLTGRLMLTDDKRWDVSLRLLRVSDGLTLWAWSFDAPYDEHRHELQEQIAKRVADGLQSYLTLSTADPVTR